jgi:nucleoside 2-deoxyribosyltransferase
VSSVQNDVDRRWWDRGVTYVYIAGPMTGIPEHNAPAFDRAEIDLIERGFVVISPVQMDREDGISLEAEAASNGDWDWARALARDIRVVICEVDAIVVLPGWTKSRGAFLETEAAYALGKPVLRYPDLEAIPYDRHPSRSQGRVVAA